jgi:predicted transcriptional regulator
MAIVGTARLRRAVTCSPEDAWREHGKSLALERHEFDNYMSGSSAACLLILDDIRRLDEPLQLDALRRDAKFLPPQSYRYVSQSDPADVIALASSAVSSSAVT